MISSRKTFQKDSVTVIKTQKSHHKTKFLVTCNNPRIASTKTQSNFCNNMSFARDNDSEKTNISWYQSWDIWVFLKQKSVSKLLTFENNPKVMKFQKKCQERGDRSLISHPSLLTIRAKTLWNSSFLTDFYIRFETNISFQNSNTQTNFLQSSNHDQTRKLRKLTSLKNFTLVTRH